jgi:hypothetical protein
MAEPSHRYQGPVRVFHVLGPAAAPDESRRKG